MRQQKNIFSEKLVELRKEKGVSQQKAAWDLGIDPSTIAKYETGDRLPDIFTLSKIADYFDVSCDYLLGRKEY
ncbi:MAG: helix-turn-helix transcriptional regulator [Clostridia bacterium]|nr:helix-turn-helix transcriptional regulator [Clostridia bacterium]